MLREYDHKFKESRHRRKVEKLLSGWYNDAAYAGNEIVASCPSVRPLSDLLEQWQKQRLGPAAAQTALLQEMWSEIVGPKLVLFTAFSRLEANGTVVIEVRHPGFLRELTRPEKQAELLDRIRNVMGSEAAQKLRFVPAGRQSGSFDALPPKKGN